MLLRKIITIIKICLKYIILVIGYLIPKDNNLILLIGFNKGNFIDNVKYFYLYLYNVHKNDLKFFFLTERIDVFDELNANELPCLYYPSIQGIYYSFRAKVLVVDSANWGRDFKQFILNRALKVQLWHGIPIGKKIEKQKSKKLNRSNKEYLKRFPLYELLISTSKFVSDAYMKTAFNYIDIIESGFPRNDCLLSDYIQKSEINCDTRCLDKINSGNWSKVLIYTPTYRSNRNNCSNIGDSAFIDNALSYESFNQYLRKNNFLLICKYHPYSNYSKPINTSNIVFYNQAADAYPLLKRADLLITDYSSIYVDFLLINRPIIFFVYDINEYYNDIEQKKNFLNNSPGHICYNEKELYSAIDNVLLNNTDVYMAQRSKYRKLYFQNVDNKASSRVYESIKQKLKYRGFN